jgi:uncharacterized protein
LKSYLPSQDQLRELVEYRMPFGKYAGWRLVEIPEAYLAWFARQGMPPGKLGVLLETALVIRSNGLEPLLDSVRRELALEMPPGARNEQGPSVNGVGDLTEHATRSLPKQRQEREHDQQSERNPFKR